MKYFGVRTGSISSNEPLLIEAVFPRLTYKVSVANKPRARGIGNRMPHLAYKLILTEENIGPIIIVNG